MATLPVGTIKSNIILKQGDTFYRTFTATDVDGVPVTGLAPNLKSQVMDRANGTLYGTLTITEDTVTGGTYIIKSGVTDGVQDTQIWKVGSAVFDIQYSVNGIVKSTFTYQFDISGDVTT